MAYLRAQIEACETFGWEGGPEFRTRIVEMQNKRERRNADWAEARHRFTLPFQNIDPERYSNIKQMHLVCRGMLHAFLYSDPLDNTADDQLFAVGDGTQTTFQLSKLSVIDGVTYQRNVYALPDDTSGIEVTSDNSPVSNYTLDPDRGLITFDSAPGNGDILRWSGPFLVWVRFNQDWLPFSIDNRGPSGFVHNGTVDLMEVPPPETES